MVFDIFYPIAMLAVLQNSSHEIALELGKTGLSDGEPSIDKSVFPAFVLFPLSDLKSL